MTDLPKLARLALRLPAMSAIVPLAVAVALEPALAHREIRFLALGDVALRPRERRPDQRPMHGPFVLLGYLPLVAIVASGMHLVGWCSVRRGK